MAHAMRSAPTKRRRSGSPRARGDAEDYAGQLVLGTTCRLAATRGDADCNFERAEGDAQARRVRAAMPKIMQAAARPQRGDAHTACRLAATRGDAETLRLAS